MPEEHHHIPIPRIPRRIETLEQEKPERTAKSKTIGRFIRIIRGMTTLITEFDETLWNATVDSVTVKKDDGLDFRFKNGLEESIKLE